MSDLRLCRLQRTVIVLLALVALTALVVLIATPEPVYGATLALSPLPATEGPSWLRPLVDGAVVLAGAIILLATSRALERGARARD